MAQDSHLRRLKEFDTVTPMALETRGPGTYEARFLIEGNSILSTLYVAEIDAGAVVQASYWDSTTGSDLGEEFALVEHKPVDAVGHDRLTVTRIHNKPNLRVVVTGGSAKFGVYVTVVSSFASDLDAALQFEGELVNVLRDKGMPITAYETTNGEWTFLRTKDGRLQIDVPGVLQVSQQTINFRRYNQSLALAPAASVVHVDYTVPAGKRLFWSAGKGTADCWCKWTVEIDGVRWLTKRNAYDDSNVELSLGQPLILTAGQRIITSVINDSFSGNSADVETWIFGSLEDV